MTYHNMHTFVSVGHPFILKLDLMKVDLDRSVYSVNVSLFYIFQFIVHLNLELGCVIEAQLFFYRFSIGISGGLWHNVA